MFGPIQVIGRQSQLPTGGNYPMVYDLAAKTLTFRDDCTIKPASGKALSFNLGASASGAVTQATSTATAVTLNKRAGIITGFASTLAAGAEEEFVVNNSEVAIGDVVAVNVGVYAGAGTPMVSVRSVGAGVFTITVTNAHAANALNAAVQYNFVVLKATG